MAVSEGNSVEARVTRPREGVRGSLLLIHGLSGSADAVYMRRTARVALDRGWCVIRLNLRNCGGTEPLSRTLYNAGQGDDAGRVLEEMAERRLPRPFFAVGFSMGGNLLLGHVGRAGADCLADAAAGVNPPLDLSSCIRSLERPANAPFQAYFTVALCSQIRRIRRVRPVPGPRAWPWVVRGVRAFDAAFTAPDAGYPDAESYYREASAGPVLPGTRIPVLVLASRNDPFVPAESVGPWVRGDAAEFSLVAGGGHVGYWQRGNPRFWAAEAVLDWFGERGILSRP